MMHVMEQEPENARATVPELFDTELNSIKFVHSKDHTCVKVKLGSYLCNWMCLRFGSRWVSAYKS